MVAPADAAPPRRLRPGDDIPVTTPEAEALSKALQAARASASSGPTIVYAFMQAVGVVDDHLEGCHRAG